MEAYWMDLVKIAKGNILLKMPIVLVTNIVSNILYAINTGTNPFELVGQYRDSIRDVKDFMAAHKEAQELKIELASLSQDYLNINFSDAELEVYNAEVSRLTDRIARLEVEMSKNEVKELFDIGMYQSVIEDIEMYKLGDTNKVSDGMDKLMNKLPTMIKTPLQIAYLSKETAWYKINQEVLQLSDLVARDVMNRKQKKIEQDQADGKRDLPLEYRKAIGRMTLTPSVDDWIDNVKAPVLRVDPFKGLSKFVDDVTSSLANNNIGVLKKLRKKASLTPPSYEEITQEMEIVRAKRYASKKN